MPTRATRTPRTLGIWIRDIIIGLVILAFVLFFGYGSGGGGSPQGAIADVDGERIERDAFEFFRAQLFDRERRRRPEGTDPVQLREFVDNSTVEMMINRAILAREARALGLVVAEAEIRNELIDNPSFAPDGRFDPDAFDRFVRQNFDNERSYLSEIERDLLGRKLRRLIQAPLRISEAVAETQLVRTETRIRLKFAVARAAQFRADVVISEDAVSAFAAAETGRLADAYDRRYAEFNQPERVRARHILFRGDSAAENAEKALARLRAGEDFVVLATELSEDTATAERGGDLGTFPRGRMLPSFEEAAFAAAERSVVGPVETERGIHLIRVEEKIPEVERSFEQVSADLARDLVGDDLAAEAAREAAKRMAGMLASGADFAAAAADTGLAVDETTPFGLSASEVPSIGRVAELREAAFTLRSDNPVSHRVFGSRDAFYLIALADRDEPDLEALSPKVAQLRDSMQSVAREGALLRLVQERRDELQNSGRLIRYPLYPTN